MKAEDIFSKFGKIIKENKVLCYAILIAVIITYGYEITNWTLTLDEEIWSYATKATLAKAWIGDGRWGTALLKLILPTYKVLPFFNGICAIFVLGIGAFLVGYIFQQYIASKTAGLAAAIVFLTIPLHSYYLMFDSFSVEISIGCVLALLSGYYCIEGCFKKKKNKIMLLIIMIIK